MALSANFSHLTSTLYRLLACTFLSHKTIRSHYLLHVGIVAVAIIPWVKRSGQGVPIVRGEDPAAIKQSRIRSLHDGMSMLQEGYQNVFRIS